MTTPEKRLPAAWSLPTKKPAGVWKPAFLDALEVTGNISAAARLAGIHVRTVHRARERSEAFERQCQEALEMGVVSLEAEARRRAMDGVDEPVYHKGEVVGHVRKYSDTLLIFLLKAHRPHKYRDNYKIEHGGQVEVTATERFVVEVVAPSVLEMPEGAEHLALPEPAYDATHEETTEEE